MARKVALSGGGNVLAVTHSFVIRSTMYLLDPARVNDPVKVENASVTKVTCDDCFACDRRVFERPFHARRDGLDELSGFAPLRASVGTGYLTGSPRFSCQNFPPNVYFSEQHVGGRLGGFCQTARCRAGVGVAAER